METAGQDLTHREFLREIMQRLRNPLNALQLHLDSLRTEIGILHIDQPTEIFDRLQRMQKNLAEIDSFLCEVLRLADLPKPQTASVDVNSLVTEVEMFARLESSKKELVIDVRLDKNLPQTQADPNQIKQAILSLLLNAIQASPPRGRITLATRTEDNHIVITVRDNGEGIAPARRDRIFEPFFSTREGALGFGLPLTLEIVRMHKGEISFKAEVGKGSEFLVLLPIAEAE